MTRSPFVRPREFGGLFRPIRPKRWHPRLAAAAAGAGAASHMFMVSVHPSVLIVALVLVMIGACVPCAVSLWRTGNPRPARMLMVMSLAMVAIHGVMLTSGIISATHSGHGVGGVASEAVLLGVPADHGAAAMLAVMVCDYLAAVLAAAWLFRLHRRKRVSAWTAARTSAYPHGDPAA